MIERGYFLPGGTLLGEDIKGVNETYRGTIEIASGTLEAFVKLLPPTQLVNELLASVLGTLCGLRMPSAYIVHVARSDYPASDFLINAGTDCLAFATVAVNAPTARRVRDISPATFCRIFADWPEWPDAASFDEWIANIDRHPGNLLLGAPGEVWLIDHSHAFTGAGWIPANLDPLVTYRNQLMEAVLPLLGPVDKFNVYSKVVSATQRFLKVNSDHAIDVSLVNRFLSNAELQALNVFVSQRAHRVCDLVGHRLGMPPLPLGVPA